MKLRAYTGLLVLTLGLIHCSAMDDVKDTKKTTESLDNKTSTLLDTTTDLRDKSKKDISNERVNARLDDLAKANDDITRIIKATELCKSFVFQQWSGRSTETAEMKMDLYEDAMFSLMPRMAALIRKNYDLNVMNTIAPPNAPPVTTPSGVLQNAGGMISSMVGAPDDNFRNLASIASVMELIERDQRLASLKTGVPAESVYSLVVKGLQYKSIYNRDPSQVPAYAEQVLIYEREAVYLLQLRHNYLPIMVLSRLGNFASTDTQEAKAYLKAWSGGQLDADQLDNAAKIEKHGVFWLQEALETQRILKTVLHYDLKFNNVLKTIFTQTHIAIPKEMKADLVAAPELASALNRLQQSMDEIKKVQATEQAPEGGVPAALLISAPVANVNLQPTVIDLGTPPPSGSLPPMPPISR